MTFTFGLHGVNLAQLPERWFELLPLCCDECSRPMGHMAAGVVQQLRGALLCSDACRALAEWNAPERR